MKTSSWIRPLSRLQSSLPLQLIGLVLLVALLSGSLIGGFMTERSRSMLREQIISSNLAGADLVAEDAARYVRVARNNADQLAGRPTIVRAVTDGNPERAEPELTRFMQFNDRSDTASLYDTRGTRHASGISQWRIRGGSSESDKDYWTKSDVRRGAGDRENTGLRSSVSGPISTEKI